MGTRLLLSLSLINLVSFSVEANSEELKSFNRIQITAKAYDKDFPGGYFTVLRKKANSKEVYALGEDMLECKDQYRFGLIEEPKVKSTKV